MKTQKLFALALICVATDSAAQRVPRSPEIQAQVRAAERDLATWTARELVPFRGEEDVRQYIRAVRKLEAARWSWNLRRNVRFAQANTGTQSDSSSPTVCAPDDKRCRLDLQGSTITVTGSGIPTVPITNNQEQGVDEGDVVKQIGRHLLVLQDGRVFVVDTEGGADRRQLVLTDRADVYRAASEEAWYDELVVYGDRIVVTGFSYSAEATEIAIFRLTGGGQFQREAVFQIHSSDYYDRRNYASRLIGDELVLCTPVPLTDVAEGGFAWPTLRRVDGQATAGGGAQLLRPEQLFRPLATLNQPVAHMITRCGLAGVEQGRPLGCETTAFVGSATRAFYASPTDAYLWSYAADDDAFWDRDSAPLCAEEHVPRRQTDRAVVYRIGLTQRSLAVAGANGFPFDQLGMDASGGQFRALVGWLPTACRPGKSIPLTFVTLGASDFSRRLRPAPDRAFVPLPSIGATQIENRFTDRFLVYGGRIEGYFERGAPEGWLGGGDAVVVPIAAPQQAHRVALSHKVWRVERIGDNAVLTGYRDGSGLSISLIDLRGAEPQLADSMRLDGRFESEGRSHAFNSLSQPDGSGLMGLPTVLRRDDSSRWSWYSQPSDLSFLSVDADGILHSLGPIEARAQRGARSDFDVSYDDRPRAPDQYRCEVSCIDWYGNSRPIFSNGRVFALTATELVEGRVERGRIFERQQLDLTGPPGSVAGIAPARARAGEN